MNFKCSEKFQTKNYLTIRMPIPNHKQREFFVEKQDHCSNRNENQAFISTDEHEFNFFANDISFDIPVFQTSYSPTYQQSENYDEMNHGIQNIFSWATRLIRILGSLRI